MDVTTKPYYKYKKDAFKKLSETILDMLKRVESLKNVVDLQFATYDELELFISFSDSKLGSIDIYYLNRVSLGTIILPIFDYDSIRFYVDPDYSDADFWIALENKEARVVQEESLALFKSSQSSSEIRSDGHVMANAHTMTVTYIRLENSSVDSVIYRN